VQVFKRLFLKLKLLENRIEIVEGMIPFRKRQTIPLRSIASVEVTKFSKQLAITTHDGKTHKFSLGGFGKAQRARDAIVEQL